MNGDVSFREKVSSIKTTFLFVVLTILFSLLFVWRVLAARFDFLAGVLLFFGCLFLFYVVNYRTLVIRLTPKALKLSFGIFSWNIPVDNIATCSLDEVSFIPRMGGAGIHFMLVGQRYRASFNFLEHPRVVIGLKKKVGLVSDVSFSTCRPDELIPLVQASILPGKSA